MPPGQLSLILTIRVSSPALATSPSAVSSKEWGHFSSHVLWGQLAHTSTIRVSSIVLRVCVCVQRPFSQVLHITRSKVSSLVHPRWYAVKGEDIFPSPSPPHGRCEVRGHLPHSHDLRAGSPAPHQQGRHYCGARVGCRACSPECCSLNTNFMNNCGISQELLSLCFLPQMRIPMTSTNLYPCVSCVCMYM